MAIIAVSLDRFSASFPDRVFKGRRRLLLWSSRTRHVKNLFLQDGAVQIVDPVAERDLCERQTHAHPIRGKVINIIQVNPADREIAKLLDR